MTDVLLKQGVTPSGVQTLAIQRVSRHSLFMQVEKGV
jgi:hypothetical protein